MSPLPGNCLVLDLTLILEINNNNNAMMNYLKLALVLLVLIPARLPAQNSGDSEEKLNILTLGDSNGTFPHSWPQQLKQALPGAEVVNISKSGRTIGFLNLGDTTLNGLYMIDRLLETSASHTKDRAFDYIIIQLGTNDAKAVFADRQKEVPRNLEKFLSHIRNSKYPTIRAARIILISPPPYGKKGEANPKYTGGNKRVKKMSKAFARVARRNDCLFVNGYKTEGLNMDKMSADGIHLDAQASRKLIEPVLDLIAENQP